MNVTALLARLKNEASVFVAEKRDLSDGTVIYILGTHVSFFPHSPQHVWYTLVCEPGQVRVEVEEIEAILRRFWHAEIDVSSWLEPPPQEST
jgi:hypothetical protein